MPFLRAATLDSVKDVLGKWGKKAAEATKKAEDLAGNMWQHCMYSFPLIFFFFYLWESKTDIGIHNNSRTLLNG